MHDRLIIIPFLICLFYCNLGVAQNATQSDDFWVTPDEESYGSDVLELDIVDCIGTEPEHSYLNDFDDRNIRTQSTDAFSGISRIDEVLARFPAVRISDSGTRLQPKNVTYRGTSSQDVIVRYQGIPINALADASADLSLIPAPLIQRADVSGTGAGTVLGGVGGLIDLYPEIVRADGQGNPQKGVKSVISGSSLGDFGLFSQGSLELSPGYGLQGVAFADHSPGQFHYIDAQNSRQTRTHNEAMRVGAQVGASTDTSRAEVKGFSFISYMDRQEPGLSEYPARFKDAFEKTWLSMSRVEAQFDPFLVGTSWAVFQIDLSHKASGLEYDNPTSFIGNVPVHDEQIENRTILNGSADFLVGTLSRTRIQLGYEAQNLDYEHQTSHAQVSDFIHRSLIYGAFIQNLSFWDDRLSLTILFRTDWQVEQKPVFSPHVAVRGMPHKSLVLWGSSSMTSRYPTFEENYFNTEFLRGNADLTPQSSIVNEVGVSYLPARWMTLSVTGFYNLHKNLIQFMPVTPYLYEAQNITHATIRGLETAVVSPFWSQFELKVSYVFMDARTDDGYALTAVPKHQVHGELSWNDDIWHASIQVSYASRMTRNLLGTEHIPERLRLNADVTFQFYPGYRLSFAIQNLLDDRKSEDLFQRPLPGRYAHFGLEISP